MDIVLDAGLVRRVLIVANMLCIGSIRKFISLKNHPHVKRVVVSRRSKPLLLATRRTREREFCQLRSLYCKFISCFSWDRLRESGVGPLIYLRRAGV